MLIIVNILLAILGVCGMVYGYYISSENDGTKVLFGEGNMIYKYEVKLMNEDIRVIESSVEFPTEGLCERLAQILAMKTTDIKSVIISEKKWMD